MITDEKRQQIIKLYEKGYTRNQIKSELHMGSDTVQSVIDDIKENDFKAVKKHVKSIAHKNNKDYSFELTETQKGTRLKLHPVKPLPSSHRSYSEHKPVEELNWNYRYIGVLVFNDEITIKNTTDSNALLAKSSRTTPILTYGIDTIRGKQNFDWQLNNNMPLLKWAYIFDTVNKEKNFVYLNPHRNTESDNDF